MKKWMFAGVLLLGSIASAEEMETKFYSVDPNLFNENIGVMNTDGQDLAKGFDDFGAEPFGDAEQLAGWSDLREQFRNYGVPFPPGSSIRYEPVVSQLIVHNTLANLEKFEIVMSKTGVCSRQIELNGAWVEFTLEDLGLDDGVSAMEAIADLQALLKLREAGKGQHIRPFKLVTINGVNAIYESVKEVIYPTAFTVVPEAAKGGVPPRRFGVQPSAFETRDVGLSVNFTPTVSPDNHTLNLTAILEYCEQVGEEDHGFDYTDENGNALHVSMVQPIFSSRNVTSSLSVFNGDTVVLGGGFDAESGRVTYLFLTPRLIDPAGKAIPKAQ